MTLPAERHREALPAGDYGVCDPNGELLAAVERKTLENLASSLSDGSLAFQMARLAELPLAAVAVEGRYAALLAHAHAPAGWLADQLVRLQTRYPQVPVAFLDSRRHAEDWTHRFLATAFTDREPSSTPIRRDRSTKGVMQPAGSDAERTVHVRGRRRSGR